MVWVFVHPLVTILLYTTIFSRLMKARIPGIDGAYSYSIYLCAGLLPWIWFSDTLGRCQNIFLTYGNLMKKTNFPRVCLPVTEILVSFLNFLVMMAVFVVFLVLMGAFPSGGRFAGLIPLIIVQMMFSSGLGILLGIFAVFIRDIGQVLSIVLQLWFWLTPIVYTSSILPERAKRILVWNPLAVLIEGYQHIYLSGSTYDWKPLGIMGGVALIVLLVAYLFYKKMVGEMVDEL